MARCFTFVLVAFVLNPRLNHLPEHTWDRLRALLDGVRPGANEPIDLSLGEPRHPMPDFVADILAQNHALYAKYPPIQGTQGWQDAVAGWLERRYGLTDIDGKSVV